MVIDDAHVLHDPLVRRLLFTLVEHGPAWMHVILASRADPAMALHRMRAQGTVLEIRDADLRFQPSETAAFLDHVGLGDLQAAQIAFLDRRTEGWPAGLQLAALSLRRVDDPAGFLDNFAGTDRHVADYLIHEVLDHQPEDVYWFLLDTSPFDLLTPALCEVVSEQSNGAKYLELLDREHLFVTRVDATGEVYRYHELFRELLQFVLRSRHPRRERQVLAAAAEWHESRGDHREAIDEWLGAGAVARAVQAMTDHAANYYDRGQPEIIQRWTDATPHLALADDVWTVLGHATRLGWSQQPDEQAHALDRAEDLLDERPDADARLVADVLQGFASLASSEVTTAHDRFLRAIELVDWENVGHEGDDAVYSSARRADLGLSLALLYLGKIEEARTVAQRSKVWHPADPAAALLIRSTLAATALADGRLRDAERRMAGIAQDMRAFGLARPFQAAMQLLSLITGLMRLEHDDPDGAIESFNYHLESIREPHAPSALLASLGIVEALAASGALDAALRRLERVRRLHRGLADPVAGGWIDAVEVRLLLTAGHLEGAEKLASALPGLPVFRAVCADVDLAFERTESARSRFAGEVITSPRDQLALAAVHARAGVLDTGRAPTEAVRQVVEIGAAEGFLRTVLDGGPVLIDSLMDDPHVSGTEYVAVLRRRRDREPAGFASSGSGAGLIEPLSERERQVMRYLSTRLSSREIASELYVSVNTVKTHVQAIYRKLGCNTRREAVERARSLRMLS